MQHCPGCLGGKSKKTIKPLVKPIPVVLPRFHDVVLDIVGPLVESNNYRYLLTIIDKTSRYFEAVPMVQASASECCRAFLNGWVSKFGIPSRASSDNGVSFHAKLWSDLHEWELLYHTARYILHNQSGL